MTEYEDALLNLCVNMLFNMKAAKLTHQQALTLVAKLPPGKKLILSDKQKWDVLIVVRDCQTSNGRFLKSLDQNVDDIKKRANILKAIDELYNAICIDDYQAELAKSSVSCKIAHQFKYEGDSLKVWELKPNNKDRVYFFPTSETFGGRKRIFLLSAYHKKDQQTPKEIKDSCEEAIKEILRTKDKIEICEEKNVAKK